MHNAMRQCNDDDGDDDDDVKNTSTANQVKSMINVQSLILGFARSTEQFLLSLTLP